MSAFTGFMCLSLGAQTPTCQQAFTLGPDQILCFPQNQTQVQVQSSWEILDLNWTVSPVPVMIDSATWSVSTFSLETLIASAEIRSPNMIINGDFSAGNTGFTSTMLSTPFTLIIPGSYAVVSDPSAIHPDFKQCQDHTTGNGLMLACNGSLLPNRDIWCQNVAVEPGGTYDLSFWAAAMTENESPELVFRIDGQNLGAPNILGPVTCEWIETTQSWTATMQSNVQVCIRNLNGANSGNDFALDDIVMRERCLISDTATVRHIPKKESKLDTLLCAGNSLVVGGQLISQTGMDTVFLTDTWGCDSSILVQAVFWDPQLTILPPDTLTCNQDLVLLSGSVNPGPGVMSFEWTDGLGNPVPGGTTLTQGVQIPGTYTLTATLTSALGSCTAVVDQVVVQDITSPLVDAGPDGILTCLIDSIQLDAGSSGSNIQATWQWASEPGQPLFSQVTIVVHDAGTYILTLTNTQNGCAASDTVEILDQQVSPGGLIANLQGPVCTGNNGLIDVSGLTTGVEPFTMVLSDSEGKLYSGPSFQSLKTGDYLLEVTDANGCQWDTILTLPDVVIPSMALPNGLTVKAGEHRTIQPVLGFSDSLVTSYQWSSANLILSCSDCPTIEVTGLESGIITLCVQLGSDCEICDQTYVSIDPTWTSYLPTAFSPNEDGINDIFRPVWNPEIVDRIESMSVFDRWGNQVYQWTGNLVDLIPTGWDGFAGSALAPSGVYVFTCQIRMITGQEKNIAGEVQLIR